MRPKTGLILLVGLLAACGDKPRPPGDVPAGSGAPVPAVAPARADSAGASDSTAPAAPGQPYSKRIVIFIEAAEAEIDKMRTQYSEADFATVADDMMFYRASAHEFLEKQHLPVQTLEGRRPLDFVVKGVVKRYDLADVTTLDIIVLYDANREPQIIAPNDLDAVTTYFSSGQ